MYIAEFQIGTDKGLLVIAGEREIDGASDGENTVVHAQERFKIAFHPVISWPVDAGATRTNAACRCGMLRVMLPRREASKLRQITSPARWKQQAGQSSENSRFGSQGGTGQTFTRQEQGPAQGKATEQGRREVSADGRQAAQPSRSQSTITLLPQVPIFEDESGFP